MMRRMGAGRYWHQTPFRAGSERVGPCGPHRLTVVVLLSLGMFLAAGACADVLVTRNGSRFEGTVTERGGSYVLVTRKGSRMAFPKSVVKEVIRSEDVRETFRKLLASSDLKDDGQVAKLLELTRTHGMAEERDALLLSAYEHRVKAAEGPEAFRTLAEWCSRNRLQEQASQCRKRTEILSFPVRLAAATGNPQALAELAVAYRKHGLEADAAEAEAAALKPAPDDDAIRRKLGHVVNPVSGKWIRAQRPAAGPHKGGKGGASGSPEWPFAFRVPYGFRFDGHRKHGATDVWVMKGEKQGKLVETLLIARVPTPKTKAKKPESPIAASFTTALVAASVAPRIVVLAVEEAAGFPAGSCRFDDRTPIRVRGGPSQVSEFTLGHSGTLYLSAAKRVGQSARKSVAFGAAAFATMNRVAGLFVVTGVTTPGRREQMRARARSICTKCIGPSEP